MNPTKKTKVKRIPNRGFYDKETVYKILDADFVCQIGFIHEGFPVVIPTIYGRKGGELFFHGAAVSRMLTNMSSGIPICLNVTQTKGIVLARSAFNHSLNYESVVIFGQAELVTNAEEKVAALEIITNQIIPNRWQEVRQPNVKELKVTSVLKLKIDEASAKIRTGEPHDDKTDCDLPIWAGVIPLERHFGKPIPDSVLKEDIQIPKSVKNLIKSQSK